MLYSFPFSFRFFHLKILQIFAVPLLSEINVDNVGSEMYYNVHSDI